MDIILSFLKIIKRAAEITKGAFRPVVLIYNLHFQIDDGVVIEKATDVQNEIFVVNIFSEYNGIENCDRYGLIIAWWKEVVYNKLP